MVRKFGAALVLAVVMAIAAGPSMAAASVTVSPSARFFGAVVEAGGDADESFCGGAGQGGCPGGSGAVQMRWGKGQNGQSAVGFTPYSSGVLDRPFPLGELYHTNATNTLHTGVTSVQLTVATDVFDAGRWVHFWNSVTMTIAPNEDVDNNPSCLFGRENNKCSDAIKLPDPPGSFLYNAGNVTYRLDILGFVNPDGSYRVFVATPEGQTRSAPLMARLTRLNNVVANAGPDQTVDEGTSVTLDGSASRVTGLTYEWQQLSGPPVALDDPAAVRPRFPVAMYTEDQVLAFQLTVRDALEPGEFLSSDTVVIRVRDLNDPPVAVAGGPYTVPEGDQVHLGGVATDPDGNIATIRWDFDGDGQFDDATGSEPVFSAVGLDGPSVVQIALEVCDTFRVCATDTARVDVTNVAPTVEVGGDITVYRNDLIDLLGTFTDPAGSLDDRYGFGWSDGPSGTTTYGSELRRQRAYALEGVYTVELAVTDKDGGEGRDDLRVTVLNKDPRCGTGRPTIPVLLVRAHEFIEVGITGLTDAEGDPLAVTVTGIRQDEPLLGAGSGNTEVDGTGVGTATAHLRAERSGQGDGRVYHVTYTVDDGHGGSCGGTVQVAVKHDHSDREPVDQGPLYDSTAG